MIIFKFHKTKDLESSGFSFEFDENSTIYELKQHIIQNFYSKEENVRYIDVEYIGDRIIRGFGKLTLEKGVISRHMDSQKFTRYSLANREIDICCMIVEDYTYSKNKIKKKTIYNKSGYLQPHLREGYNENLSETKQQQFVYNPDDFPPLG